MRGGFKNSEFYWQIMYELISAFSTQKFCSFEANISFNISPKTPAISAMTKFYKLFKCLESVRIKHDAFFTQMEWGKM